jgi:hypothetical protein
MLGDAVTFSVKCVRTRCVKRAGKEHPALYTEKAGPKDRLFTFSGKLLKTPPETHIILVIF